MQYSGVAVVTVLLSAVAVYGSGQGVTHCLPGDQACAQCQGSCDAIPLGALPECCEAFSACCPTYSSSCKQCSSNAAIDSHFPEYCCASFTDCCDLVPGLNIVGTFSAKQQSKKTSKKSQSKPMTNKPRAEPAKEVRAEPPLAAEEPQVLPAATTGVSGSGDADKGPLFAPPLPPRLSVQPRVQQEQTVSTDDTVSPARTRGRGKNNNDSNNAGDDSLSSSTSQNTRSRSRQAIEAQRRTHTASNRKVQQAASSITRRGRITSRGRVVQ